MCLVALLLLALSSAAFSEEWRVLSGQQSVIARFRTAVASDADSWRDLWLAHHGSPEGMPQVDFSKEQIVGVFLGLRNSSGHSVRVEVQEKPEGVLVNYEIVPPKGFAAAVFTKPFTFVKVPAGRVDVVSKNGSGVKPSSEKAPPIRRGLESATKRIQALGNAITTDTTLFD